MHSLCVLSLGLFIASVTIAAVSTDLSRSDQVKACATPTLACKDIARAFIGMANQYSARYGGKTKDQVDLPSLCTDSPIISTCLDRYVAQCGANDASLTAGVIDRWNQTKPKLAAMCVGVDIYAGQSAGDSVAMVIAAIPRIAFG